MELLMGSGQKRTETGGSSSTESSTLTTGLRFGRKIYFEEGSGSRLSKNRKSTTARFHQRSEFDLEKRSCRRRLACHNERRRKPQATTDTLLASVYSTIAQSLYGIVLGDPTTWSTARSVMGRITWPGMVNNNSTDSSCALSLLSNSNKTQQQEQQLQTSTNAYLMTADRVTMAQSPNHNQYLNQTWEFMSGEKSNFHHVSPVFGLSQISEPDDLQFLMSSGTTMGGFELNLHQ
ncbi:hypothetical protein Bca101_046126 [Brassica carinata]